MYIDPTGHFNIFNGDDWVNLYNSGKKKIGQVKDAVVDTVSDAWDTTTEVVSNGYNYVNTNIVQPTKEVVKQAAKYSNDHIIKPVIYQAEVFKEGASSLINSKKRKEAFETIDTYGSNADKFLARFSAGTAAVSVAGMGVATAVFAAPAVTAFGIQAYGMVSSSAVGTYLWYNSDVGFDVYNLGSDLYNGNWGNLPMDALAFAYNGSNYGANYRAGKPSNNNVKLNERQQNFRAVMANKNSSTGGGGHFDDLPLVNPRSLNRIEPAPNQSVLSKSTLPNLVKNEAYIYVVDAEGAIQIAPRLSTGKSGVKHTQLNGGAPAKGAGEMMLADDGILYINNQSGRYRAQDINAVNQVKTQLEEWDAQVKIVKEEIK